MGLWLAVIYDIGVIISFFVYNSRAGFGEVSPGWREYVLPNLGYFTVLVGKIFTWPIVLVVWLVQGRRDSPWKVLDEQFDREVRKIVRTGGAGATAA